MPNRLGAVRQGTSLPTGDSVGDRGLGAARPALPRRTGAGSPARRGCRAVLVRESRLQRAGLEAGAPDGWREMIDSGASAALVGLPRDRPAAAEPRLGRLNCEAACNGWRPGPGLGRSGRARESPARVRLVTLARIGCRCGSTAGATCHNGCVPCVTILRWCATVAWAGCGYSVLKENMPAPCTSIAMRAAAEKPRIS